MRNRLSKEQIEDLIMYCGSTPTFWRDDNMLICCPVHGESNPSCGISSELQVFHCFSCSASGNFAKMLILSRPDDFGYNNMTDESEKKTWGKAYRKAKDFLKDRYELEYRDLYKHTSRFIKKYEDFMINVLEDKNEIPMWKIAPFQSGKKTYRYFFRRGFDEEDMIKFKIGFDDNNRTVTIPVFNEKNRLVGVIGRYIDKRRKNERYKIYDHFKRSDYLYPENLLEVVDDTIILVEGQFDAIYMHKLKYKNTLAIMTDVLSDKQIEFLEKHCSKVIYIGDNDERGLKSRNTNYEKLKGKVEFKIVDFPKEGKDVCDWNEKEIKKMVNKAHSFYKRSIKRY